MIEYQRFSKFSKLFERSGYYHFEAIASSESVDSYGTKFDLDTLRPAVPYLPIHIEHDSQPVGSVVDFWRNYEYGESGHFGETVQVAGEIDIALWPDIVQSIKTGGYAGVSIGGAYDPKNAIDGVIYNAIINEISLTDSPSNPDAVIYKRHKKNIDPLEYLRLSQNEQVQFFRAAGFSEKMANFLTLGIQRAMD